MIFDTIDNAHLYHDLGPRIATALQFLTERKWVNLPVGVHPIEGDDSFFFAGLNEAYVNWINSTALCTSTSYSVDRNQML